MRGLYHFYEELALRFAERGYAAIAIDYFGRTAGAEKRDDDFEYMPHVDQTTDDGVQADTRAAVEHLRGLGVSVGLHASASASAAAPRGSRRRRVTASRARSASTARRPGSAAARAPSQRVEAIECPILALQAGDDQGITAEDNATFERALTDAGVEHEIVVYDGAPHSFFDRKQEEFADASDDAWRRTLAFVDSHALILAIDQGTTGTTCLVVDDELHVLGRGYRELPQHFPRPGWVEHDPEEIWLGVRAPPSGARAAGVRAAELDAIGITNQRETTLLWDRATGEPVGAGDRLAGPAHRRALPRARRRS